MIRFSFYLCLMMLIVNQAAMAWPWSQDMMNQPSLKPQETYQGKIFQPPQRSIPVGGRPTQVASREAAIDFINPIEATPKSIKQGKQLYGIYCAACHGLSGQADTPLSQKIFAINLTSEYVQKNLTEGWLWGTITFGSAIMPAYGVSGDSGGANDLTVVERWHVVNFVRHSLTTKSDSGQ